MNLQALVSITFLIFGLLTTVGFPNSNEAYKYVKPKSEN